MAAAVIADSLPEGVKDSKRCTSRRREALAEAIDACGACWAIGTATVSEIDTHNILRASLLAMKRAVEGLLMVPAHVLVDGPHAPEISVPCSTIIGGDASEPLIGAASILAKTHRDALMRGLAREFPDYGFEQHKGYGTKIHLNALYQKGPSIHHRKSFAPVRAAALQKGHTF